MRIARSHFGFDAFSCGEIDIAHRDRSVFYIIEWPESWRKFYIGSGLIERATVANGHMERLIGTVRRGCLGRMLISGAAHLRQIYLVRLLL